jgi:hypothetical protein
MIRAVVVSALLAVSVIPDAHAGWQDVAKACNTSTICASVKPGGGRIIECLKAHVSSLSDDCFTAYGRAALGEKASPGKQLKAEDHPGQVLQSDGTYAPAPAKSQ